ncbi:MAG: porin family protein [Bacteroidota bacterium]
MKKIFLVITILFTAHCLFAQNVKFGIQGGMNMASIGPNAPQNGGAKSQAYATFQFGGVLDIAFKDFTLQPGILLTGKGNHSTTTENFVSNGAPVPYTMTHLTNVSYIEVPVNFLYTHAVKPGKFYAGAGPYIAHAVWGSFSQKSDLNTYYKNVKMTDITFGSGTDQFNATDFGANVLAGLELNNGLTLGLNYGLGFSNITNDGTSAKNRVFSVVVGYKF